MNILAKIWRRNKTANHNEYPSLCGHVNPNNGTMVCGKDSGHNGPHANYIWIDPKVEHEIIVVEGTGNTNFTLTEW